MKLELRIEGEASERAPVLLALSTMVAGPLAAVPVGEEPQPDTAGEEPRYPGPPPASGDTQQAVRSSRPDVSDAPLITLPVSEDGTPVSESSNGRTAGLEPADEGSIPSSEATAHVHRWRLPASDTPVGHEDHPEVGVLIARCDCGETREQRPWSADVNQIAIAPSEYPSTPRGGHRWGPPEQVEARRQRVLEMKRRGRPEAEIARVVGLSPGRISQIVSEARKAGELVPAQRSRR